ncbi:nuclear transport factor 2 family protein [Parahaliea mediterranea]|uniref:Nuclear transport factor 2 family protein n=1 Tax=Parahaliea mediterranea TaxID=651086 RepID=A0A939IPB8_9GAMM|nr:nuclear transport factor 2 family protein [Parahaliea mediterranea]MBN7798887.1 nuclear transport factor 2 family protein [Parahaliea mediterranea]
MESQDKLAIVDRYVEAFANNDLGIIRELFADDATVEDPVGSDIHRGIEAICAFYEGALGAGPTLALSGVPRCAGNAVAFPFQVRMPGMSLDVIDVFEFNDAGKIASMKAYWGPDNVHKG